jgi:uncharacterized protein (DUF305 family)
VFAGSYWGLHHALYGLDGRSGVASAPGATHTHDPERPHEAPATATPRGQGHAHGAPAAAAAGSAQAAYLASMQRMHRDMEAGVQHPDPDQAFVRGMIAHHRAAIEMAQIQLEQGKDPQQRKLAQAIIDAQKSEIAEMNAWLESRNRGS